MALPPRRSLLVAFAAAVTVFALEYPRAWITLHASRAPAAPAVATAARPSGPEAALAETMHRREAAERLLNSLAPLVPQWTLAGDELAIELDSVQWDAIRAADQDAWMIALASNPAIRELGYHVIDFYVGERRVRRVHVP